MSEQERKEEYQEIKTSKLASPYAITAFTISLLSIAYFVVRYLFILPFGHLITFGDCIGFLKFTCLGCVIAIVPAIISLIKHEPKSKNLAIIAIVISTLGLLGVLYFVLHCILQFFMM